jgi:hypothetical protein
MRINREMLKYGYWTFSLEILEFCETQFCIQRELFYFDLIKQKSWYPHTSAKRHLAPSSVPPLII